MNKSMNEETHTHVKKISQLSLGIAIFALILLIVLYAVMRSQSSKTTTQTNTNTTVSSLTNEQLQSMNAEYEQTVANIIDGYVNGTTSAQAALLAVEQVRVTTTYKNVHVQLSALLGGDSTDDAKKEKLRTLDAQYAWILK